MKIDAHALIVDGRNVLWRNCAANSQLGFNGPDGWQMTGGIYGFFESVMSVLWKLEDDVDIWVAWEGEGGRERRRSVIPEYKVRKPDPNREKMSEQVWAQEEILKEILPLTSWGQVVAPGWEADDAMGTMVAAYHRNHMNSLILSNDADLLQTIRGGTQGWVRVFKAGADEPEPIWDDNRLMSEWGVSPRQVIDVKALAGDASDNYSGAKGIGEVWARKIISEYGTVEKAIEYAEKNNELLGSKSKAEKVLLSADYVRLCRDVAEIRTNVKVVLTEGQPEPGELRERFKELRFASLLDPRPFRRIVRR